MLSSVVRTAVWRVGSAVARLNARLVLARVRDVSSDRILIGRVIASAKDEKRVSCVLRVVCRDSCITVA